MVQVNGLKKYIKRLYGTQKNCADKLGVNRRTVCRWIYDDPKPMLRYADSVVKTCDTTKLEFIGEVLYHNEQLNE